MLLSRTCPTCRTGGTQLRRNRCSHGNWAFKECLACGFVFPENPPDYATLQGQFPCENTSGLQNEARRKLYCRGENVVRSAIRGVRSLTNTVIRRNKHVSLGYRYFREGWIVDLGCGLGNFGPPPPDLRGPRLAHYPCRRVIGPPATGSCVLRWGLGRELPLARSAAGRSAASAVARFAGRECNYPQVAELCLLESTGARKEVVWIPASRPCELLYSGHLASPAGTAGIRDC
jgi:hypothetical protein